MVVVVVVIRYYKFINKVCKPCYLKCWSLILVTTVQISPHEYQFSNVIVDDDDDDDDDDDV
jgi:hypothetical protein